MVSSIKEDWYGAKSFCEQTYVALTIIESYDENQALKTHLQISIEGEFTAWCRYNALNFLRSTHNRTT